MSEFGAAAVYGCHDNDDFLWTEEYQAKLIEHCLNLFHSYPGVVGSLIWQFADARTSKEAGISRARRFNNKGLINEYRKPKLAYFAAQRCFKKFAGEKGE
jgi:beta-glucuronidase